MGGGMPSQRTLRDTAGGGIGQVSRGKRGRQREGGIRSTHVSTATRADRDSQTEREEVVELKRKKKKTTAGEMRTRGNTIRVGHKREREKGNEQIGH